MKVGIFCRILPLASFGSERVKLVDRFSLLFHFRLDTDESGPQVMY